MSAPAPDGFVEVARLDDVPDGGVLGVEARGARVCLVRRGERVSAMEDACPHQAFPLSAGELLPDGTLQCTWHGARFDCESGAVVQGPATDPVALFPVRVEDGRVLVGPRES